MHPVASAARKALYHHHHHHHHRPRRKQQPAVSSFVPFSSFLAGTFLDALFVPHLRTRRHNDQTPPRRRHDDHPRNLHHHPSDGRRSGVGGGSRPAFAVRRAAAEEDDTAAPRPAAAPDKARSCCCFQSSCRRPIVDASDVHHPAPQPHPSRPPYGATMTTTTNGCLHGGSYRIRSGGGCSSSSSRSWFRLDHLGNSSHAASTDRTTTMGQQRRQSAACESLHLLSSRAIPTAGVAPAAAAAAAATGTNWRRHGSGGAFLGRSTLARSGWASMSSYLSTSASSPSSPTSLPSSSSSSAEPDSLARLPRGKPGLPPLAPRTGHIKSNGTSHDSAMPDERRDGDGGCCCSTTTTTTTTTTTMREPATAPTSASRLSSSSTPSIAAPAPAAEAVAALRALAQSGLPDAHLRAERYLVRLEQHEMESRRNSRRRWSETMTVELYEIVIRAWADADREDPALAVTRAERWLNKLMDPHSTFSNSSAATVDPADLLGCFNAFLDLCSKGRGLKKNHRGQAKGMVWRHALKAEQILDWMIDNSSSSDGANGINGGYIAASSPAPDIDSFNYVIRAWTRCRNSPDVANKALEALKKLELYHEQVDSTVRPNTRSYAMVMDAVAVKAKLKVRQIRNRPEHHDDPSLNGMDEIRLLNEMITYLEREHEDDLVSSSSQDRWTDAAPSPSRSLATHRHILNALISAWSNLSLIHPDAPAQAEDILHQMMSRRDTLEAGCGEDGGVTGEAPAVLDSPVLPDSTTFLLVMRSWANSSDPARGDRVQHWLERQWLEHELDGLRESVRPTVASYNMAMRVWADLGVPDKAEAALMELLSRSKSYMTEIDAAASSLSPNSESYALVIRGWLSDAERGDKFALAQAVRWLDAVRDLEDRDSGRTSASSVLTQVDMYGGILSASRHCASRHPDVLEIAVATFEKLRMSHHPVDCLHYSRLLQVGITALSGRPGKDPRARLAEFVARIFRDCCEDGLMSKPFVRALVIGPSAFSSHSSSHQSWTTDGEYRIMVTDLLLPFYDNLNDESDDADNDLSPFPASWTRNVRQVGLLPTRRDLESALSDVRQQPHGHDLQ